MKDETGHNFRKQDGLLWHPVFTLARNEKKVHELLKGKGIDSYLPVRNHINIQPVFSKGKSYCYKRKLTVPMFSNYLFACLSYDNCAELLKNRSVIRILPVTPLDEDSLIEELKIIHTLENFSQNEKIDVANGIVKGTRVKFIDGQFLGWEGVALDNAKDDGFVYINITSVDASIRLKYPAMWCEAIEKPTGK